MKNVAFVALVLCSLLNGCKRKETPTTDLWRTVEPRLTTASQWKEFREPKPQQDPEDCPEFINDVQTASRTLTELPHCTSEAVAAYERLSRVDRRNDVDLSAAYHVRAKRDAAVDDFLPAIEAADRAVEALPRSPAAHFNRALVLQELGLYDEALEVWDAFLKLEPTGKWADEARAHQARIRPLRPESNALLWKSRKQQILRSRNPVEIAGLIGKFPQTALQWFEDELLTECAAAPTPEKLAQMRVIAAGLSKRLRDDRLPVEAVEAIARATVSPPKRAALAEGHRLYRAGRRGIDRAIFRDAQKKLRDGGSPLAFVAQQRSMAYAPNEFERAMSYAFDHQYHSLFARLHLAKVWVEWGASTYPTALASNEQAVVAIERTADEQQRNSSLIQISGVTRLTGMNALAFRQALAAVHFPYPANVREQHNAYGEAAAAAGALGRSRAALHYQNAAVKAIRRGLVADRYENLVKQLADALRSRAAIHLTIGNGVAARRDLDEALGLYKDLRLEKPLRSRISEIVARQLLASDPARAITVFTAAIKDGAAEYHTYRAFLLAQRASAWRRVNNTGEAANDLRQALRILREEEAAILRRRESGEREEIWPAYFSRFSETYEDLIRQLVDAGERPEAFSYVERSRGFEPLELIARRSDTPQAFRELLSKYVTPADIQKHLPEGTFVLQYSVFADRTLIWILSKDHFHVELLQDVKREQVERWSDDVQRALQKNVNALDDALIPPYGGLIAPALDRIKRLNGGRNAARLVIIPDEAMRGIPLVATINPVDRTRLIEYAPISFAGSATLYVYSHLRSHALWTAKPRSILLVASPGSEATKKLKLVWLENVSKEVETIGARHKGPKKTLVGAEATITNFLADAPHYDILHFAGHSMALQEEPYRSVLFFSDSSVDDGKLEAQRLLKELDLSHTTLFVMSSCQSADNLPVGPEGVAPLVRPLITKGVPAVIGSLWSVDDATTSDLLVSFYDEYRRSGDAAASLQKAQIAMLRDKNRTTSVLTWGAFQLIGDTAPPRVVLHQEHKEKPP